MERVGIVRGLYYYETGEFWKTFFQMLGYEIVMSEKAKSSDMDITEACWPIRSSLLHVQNLLDMHVDYIFLPRVLSQAKGYRTCPKIQGICNQVRAYCPEKKLLDPIINAERKGCQGLYQLGQMLGIPAGVIRRICKELPAQNMDYHLPENPYIVILGHPYILHDMDTGIPILRYLEQEGYDFVTTDSMPDEVLLTKGEAVLKRRMFWHTGQKQIGLLRAMLERPLAPAGVLYVSTFGCGVDDFIWPICKRMTEGRIPFLHITLDNQHQDTGVMTRLEAFADLIERSAS